MDYEFDTTFSPEQDEFLFSQKVATDSVIWQNSQPPKSAALNSLILDVSTIPARRKVYHETSWYIPEPSTSSSSSQSSNNARPLTRTNSRSRFGRQPEPTLRDPLSTPEFDLFNTKDPTQFLNIVKGISERVDESIGIKTALSGDMTSRKKRTVAPRVIDPTKARRARPPHRQTGEGQLDARSLAGKQRANSMESFDCETQDRVVQSSRSRLSSSPSSPVKPYADGESAPMDIDVVNTSKDMSMLDVTIEQYQNASISSHPHLTLKRGPAPRQNSASTVTTLNPTSTDAFNPVTPTPKPHPLLTQKPPQPPQPMHSNPPPQLPTSNRFTTRQDISKLTRVEAPAPSASNPSRPPVLGMRRSRGTVSHATSRSPTGSQRPSAERAKSFKPPLLPGSQCPPNKQHADSYHPVHQPPRQQHAFNTRDVKPEASTSTRAPSKGVSDATHPAKISGVGVPVRSSSPNLDPDSSYGDLSFDLDALEATMRKYD